MTTKPTKHLDSLTIKNFRILEDVEIKKLGHVNLIVGKNNSGKSTVLEALALLASGFNRKTIQKIIDNRNSNRYMRDYNSLNELSVRSFFKDKEKTKQMKGYDEVFIGNHNINVKFEYTDDSSFCDSETEIFWNKNDYSVKIDDPDESGYGTLIQAEAWNAYEEKTGTNYTSRENHKKYEIYNCQYVETILSDLTILEQEWEKTALTDEEDLVIEMLQLIEPSIINLAFLTPDDSLDNDVKAPYVRLKNIDGRVPLHEMGDGVIRLLQIILKVVHARDGFLLIDEFENGLHYSVQAEVWRLIFELAERFNIQVFATTHSWDCIESFAEVAKESEDLDGVLFRMGRSVRKSDKGKVIATVYNEEELHYITKSQMEVR